MDLFIFAIVLIVVGAAVSILHSIASEILHINRVAALTSEVNLLHCEYLAKLRSKMSNDNEDGEIIEVEESTD